jgi:hypothetical protein
MAEVIHRYVGRGDIPARKRSEKLDAEWRRKRISAESAKQALHEAKMLAMRGELISKRHAVKQASFLILSLRARLLALGGTLSPSIVKAGGDQRAIESLIDAEVRAALDELAGLPQRVVDPHWPEKLDELDNEAKA